MTKRIALVLVLLAGPPGGRADQVPPVFHSAVEVINLNVCVTDGRNRYITDLAEGDFTVLEDGVLQQVSMFTRRRLDLSLVIMIDTSASMEPKLPVARAAALRLVQALGPQDKAEVIQFNDRTAVLQDFTSDGQALERAINATRASGATALYTGLYGPRFVVQSSDAFAQAIGYPSAPVDDLLAFHTVFGKTVPDISLNAIANLGYAECRFLKPVYAGDTLIATSEVIGLRENANKTSGVVYVRTTGRNQHGERVLE